MDEQQKKNKWSDDVMIQIPLRKFVKMKTKIIKLDQEAMEERRSRYNLYRELDEAKDTIKKLKEQIAEMIGMEGEENK